MPPRKQQQQQQQQQVTCTGGEGASSAGAAAAALSPEEEGCASRSGLGMADELLSASLEKLEIDRWLSATYHRINSSSLRWHARTRHKTRKGTRKLTPSKKDDKSHVGLDRPKKTSIIREAVLKLRSSDPTCLSDNHASTLLSEACKLSISHKAKTFGHGSVTNDFKSLNLGQNARHTKDDASIASDPAYQANSFQRARSNTMPTTLKRSTTATADTQNGQTANTCSLQARISPPPCDVTIDELASYFEEFVHIPKKMSRMAEMMYI